MTYNYATECFELINGVLYWKHRPLHHFLNIGMWKRFNNKYVGKIAGTKNNIKGEYRWMVNILNKTYYRYQIVWLLTHKEFPKAQITHINKNTLNDWAGNLALRG